MSDQNQVRTAHLLIKHNQVRNPISRRTNDKITITPSDAYTELQQYQQKIKEEGYQSFPKYAQNRSDCSSYLHGGDLGYFGRGTMQKAFEDASFSLNIGEMSDIVQTDSGYHLIYRIE